MYKLFSYTVSKLYNIWHYITRILCNCSRWRAKICVYTIYIPNDSYRWTIRRVFEFYDYLCFCRNVSFIYLYVYLRSMYMCIERLINNHYLIIIKVIFERRKVSLARFPLFWRRIYFNNICISIVYNNKTAAAAVKILWRRLVLIRIVRSYDRSNIFSIIE